MNFTKLEETFQKTFKKKDNLKYGKAATYIVEAHTVDLTEDQKNDLAGDMALGLAMGEAITKNKYLLIGGAIGVGATALTIGVVNKIKKLRKAKEQEN